VPAEHLLGYLAPAIVTTNQKRDRSDVGDASVLRRDVDVVERPDIGA
jgi:hypothetical protein